VTAERGLDEVVGLRDVTDGDEPFLREVYASSREEELAAVPWSSLQRSAFLDMQFAAQAADYARRFPRARHELVLLDGAPVGRLWVNRDEDELRLLDITLLAPCRGLGVGSVVLRRLQREAAAAGLPLRHTVLTTNVGAQRLYERVGFVEVDRTETHILMQWQAG
jgi:ribosomal protein S18 acetylase RimI-like enzyme